jgi:hypothetical protein
MNTREIFESFASNQPSEHQKVVHYIKNTPFREDYWKGWKKLFKLTEKGIREVQDWEAPASERLLDLITHFLIRIDQHDIFKPQGKFPTKLTVRYMKRRGRRLMWFFAKNAPQQYRKIAENILLSYEGSDPFTTQPLDYRNHWITLDILLGKSRRSKQTGHGQGPYVFESERYHLHHPEEGMAAAWNADFDFIKKLVSKNLPWQMYDFAVKVLHRNQQSIAQIGEHTLLTFFQSPSQWLRLTARDYISQQSATTTFAPQLLAYHWFYNNSKVSENLIHSQNAQIKQSAFAQWMNTLLGIDSLEKKRYKQFKNALQNLIIQELKKGNTSRRISRSIDLLKDEGGFIIPTQEVYAIAETLFKLDNSVARNIAFKVAKDAQTYDAPYWLNAARHSEAHLERLIEVYRDKMSNVYRYSWGHREFSDYMFVPHAKVINFGWELAERYLRVNEVTAIWGKLVRSKKDNALELLKLNIQATNAIQWFTVSHSNQMEHLYTYSPERIAFIIKEGTPPISNLLLNQITQSFEFNPLMFLYLVSCLSHPQRKAILQKCLPKFDQQTLVIDEGFLAHTMQRLDGDDWGIEALLAITSRAQVTQEDVDHVVGNLLKEVSWAKIFVQKMDMLLGAPNETLFMRALGKKPDNLLVYSAHIPNDLWVGLLSNMLEDQQERFKQAFAQVVLTLGSEVLEITYPVFEDALVSWLKNHPSQVDIASGLLFKVCIHRLPKVRQWGHNHVLQTGLTPNFALQLLESGLPETVGFAKTYFDGITIDHDNFVDNLLALCDSPKAATRGYGLSLLKKIDIGATQGALLLAYLSEHSDVQIQTYVAEKLLEQKPTVTQKPPIKAFDKAMLRRKNRNKTAREHVKKRWSQHTEVDVNTLLELAKTGNQKDAEWAIIQLTKLSLQGKEINGFVLD